MLMVGFNRRFAPGILAIKSAIANRRAPLVINYRLNAGYLPPDHWVHGPQGGGRNIGEACHMYDVFRSLTGAPVRSIAATPIDPGTPPALSEVIHAAIAGSDYAVVTDAAHLANIEQAAAFNEIVSGFLKRKM